jgi:hypothetical protein
MKFVQKPRARPATNATGNRRPAALAPEWVGGTDSTGAATGGTPRTAANRKYRGHVYGEILETERSYVEDLSTLCDVFLAPLRSNPCGLTTREVDTIHSNAGMLHAFHLEFYADLSSKGLSANILETFEKNVAYFNMYSVCE